MQSSISSSDEGSMANYSSSVASSDLDEFIMSATRKKKTKKSTDGLMVVGGEKSAQRKKTSTVPPSRLSPQVRDLLGKGSMCFVQRNYDLAIEYLEEAVRLAPGVADPFVTLGAIYEELGDTKRSIEALLVAVHLNPGDHLLWKRVALQSESIGQLEQTAYCLKRCVKSSSATEEEKTEYMSDLSNVLMQLSEFASASVYLRTLFTASHSLEHGTSLAKCLYNMNEKPEAMTVLESLFDAGQFDANSVNMLAEVYLDIREFGRCFTLLTSILDMDNLSDPEKCPVDLVAKLAIAAAPSKHAEIVTQSVLCVSRCPVETHSDLYMSVADGLISAGLVEMALNLCAVNEASIGGLHLRTGRCHYLLEQYEAAVCSFEKCLNSDPETIVMHADALRRIGRETEAGELMSSSISYEDLLACRTLPSATSTADRRKKLTQLEIFLDRKDYMQVANLYIPLFGDCELDVQRVARHRGNAVPAWRIRKELDLESVEDRVGTEKFVHLVGQCSEICALVGRHNEAVNLLETILHNKRKKWLQRTTNDAGDVVPDIGSNFVTQLENLSFKIASADPKLFKTSIKYLRQYVGQFPAKTTQFLATMSRIIFENKNLSPRDLLDQRSWLVRTACKQEEEQFGLCLFAGHFCMYACNYSFAVQEYMRAHRLRQSDPWPLLCLASAMLSLAMSRTSGAHWLDKAFSVLAHYAREEPTQPEYNLGRACHQISHFTQADRCYRKVLKNGSSPQTVLAAYNLSLIRQKSNLDSSSILLKFIVAK